MTRFAGLPAVAARAVLIVVIALMALGIVLSASPIASDRYLARDVSKSDTALYGAVAERVARGEGYYDAAAQEHRLRGYPLKPFLTVRLPASAWLVAALGPALAMWLQTILVVLVLVAGSLRLREAFERVPAQAAAFCCMAFGVAFQARQPDLAYWHEVWAALLVALSLYCHRDGRYGVSLLLGLLAVAFRELALPYLAVMAVAALLERRPREALAWSIGAAVALAGIAFHALEVSGRVLETDIASPGWVSFGGWNLVLNMVRATSALSLLPAGLAPVVVPLALLGWAAWRSAVGLRGFLLMTGYCCAFMAVGRTNNMYWGLMLAPLLFVGLAWAPAALADLVRAATGQGANRPVPKTEAAVP